MTPKANIDHIEGILSSWKHVFGQDFAGYRNHVVRMTAFCLLLKPCDTEEQQKIEIAACFHDIGIWTDNTLDYLRPSLPPALEYLAKQNLGEWSAEITQMILQHHKIRPVEKGLTPLIELFRKGDLVDFSLGLIRFGLARETVQKVKAAFPNAGFHKTLVKLAGHWFLGHPLNPAPMMKW